MGAEASTHVDASPETVYDLIADLPAMGRWSPECVRCEWLGGATAAAPGARFRGHNRLGWRRWSTIGTVVTADRGRELTWDVSFAGLPIARWSYRIQSENEGSSVTEVFEDRRRFGAMKYLGALASGVADRDAHNKAGMQETLARLKAVAENS